MEGKQNIFVANLFPNECLRNKYGLKFISCVLKLTVYEILGGGEARLVACARSPSENCIFILTFTEYV